MKSITSIENSTPNRRLLVALIAGIVGLTYGSVTYAGGPKCNNRPNHVRIDMNALGTNIYYGSSNNEVIIGTSGNDTIYGGGGNDIICGRAGTDSIYGMQGNDLIFGMQGDDYLFGGGGTDTIYGGYGQDYCNYGVYYENDTLIRCN